MPPPFCQTYHGQIPLFRTTTGAAFQPRQNTPAERHPENEVNQPVDRTRDYQKFHRPN